MSDLKIRELDGESIEVPCYIIGSGNASNTISVIEFNSVSEELSERLQEGWTQFFATDLLPDDVEGAMELQELEQIYAVLRRATEAWKEVVQRVALEEQAQGDNDLRGGLENDTAALDGDA